MQGVTLIDLLILNNFFYRKHTTTIIVVIIDYCGITDTVLCLLIVSHRKDKLGTWGLGQKKKKNTNQLHCLETGLVTSPQPKCRKTSGHILQKREKKKSKT